MGRQSNQHCVAPSYSGLGISDDEAETQLLTEFGTLLAGDSKRIVAGHDGHLWGLLDVLQVLIELLRDLDERGRGHLFRRDSTGEPYTLKVRLIEDCLFRSIPDRWDSVPRGFSGRPQSLAAQRRDDRGRLVPDQFEQGRQRVAAPDTWHPYVVKYLVCHRALRQAVRVCHKWTASTREALLRSPAEPGETSGSFAVAVVLSGKRR